MRFNTFAWSVALGTLMLVLGIPLAVHAVPPNGLYGYRVSATLSNPAVWYYVNGWMGIGMAITGLLTILTAALVGRQAPRHNWLAFWVLLGGLAVSALLSTLLLLGYRPSDTPPESSVPPQAQYPMATYWVMFLGISLLIIGLHLPLAMKRIRPNALYGFRVRATMRDERVWYLANAYFARMAIGIGIVTIALATLLRFTTVPPAAYIAICVLVFFGGLILAIILTFRHIGQIGGNSSGRVRS